MVNSHKHQRKYKNITKKRKEKKNNNKGKVTKYTIKHKKTNKIKKTNQNNKSKKSKKPIKQFKKHSNSIKKSKQPIFDDNNLAEIDKNIDEYLDEMEKATRDYYKNYKQKINEFKINIKKSGNDFGFDFDFDSEKDNSKKNIHHGGFIGSFLAFPFKAAYYSGKALKDGGKWLGKGAAGLASTAASKVSHSVGKFSAKVSKGSINAFRAIPGFRSGRIIRNTKGEKVFMSKGKTIFGTEPSSTAGLTNRLNYINERIGGKRQKLDKLLGKVNKETLHFESKIANLNQKILNTKDPKLLDKYTADVAKFKVQMEKAQLKFKDKIDNARKRLEQKVQKYAGKTEELKKKLAEKVRKSEKRIREGFVNVCSQFGRNGKLGSELACQNAMKLCGGHTSKNPIEQTLACMNSNPEFERLGLSLSKGDLIQEMTKNAKKKWFVRNRHLKEIKKIESGKVSEAQRKIQDTDKRILETSDYAKGKKYNNIIQVQSKEAMEIEKRAAEDLRLLQAAHSTRTSGLGLNSIKIENLATSKAQAARIAKYEKELAQKATAQQATDTIKKHENDVKSVESILEKEQALLNELKGRSGVKPALLEGQQLIVQQRQKELFNLQNPSAAAAAEAKAAQQAAPVINIHTHSPQPHLPAQAPHLPAQAPHLPAQAPAPHLPASAPAGQASHIATEARPLAPIPPESSFVGGRGPVNYRTMTKEERQTYLAAQKVKGDLVAVQHQNLQNFMGKSSTPEAKMRELYELEKTGQGAMQREFGHESLQTMKNKIKASYPRVIEKKYLSQHTLQDPHDSFRNLETNIKNKLTSEQTNFFSKYGIIRDDKSLSIIDNTKIAEIEHAIASTPMKSLQTTTFSNAGVHKGYISDLT